ncbi:hypothetical protein [Actinomadura montaniterrae]|uniref:Uncharacterized protein n=1 Tax=Actinomadura montaniterrae TaxID=1803903 RepID=A0A6L3W459_9ACTN|nr:hypothetical protein [Actinomadura montaniterrae]KAB2386426.1 hypothetical protein F9B16_07070 [Actinomadura montaniterrae]
MTTHPKPPRVRVVKVRLSGQDDDAAAIAELLARLLPTLSEGRCQVGEISGAYPNRRGAGARRYLDLYLLDPTTDHHDPGRDGDPPSGSQRNAPGQLT